MIIKTVDYHLRFPRFEAEITMLVAKNKLKQTEIWFLYKNLTKNVLLFDICKEVKWPKCAIKDKTIVQRH